MDSPVTSRIRFSLPFWREKFLEVLYMSAVVDDTPLSQSATVDKEAVQPFPRS